jgi:gamma-glutamyl-gamma-aminobutyrate hydrolase PuuD
VVEAFEVEGRPEVFALQWHPEMLSDQTDPAFLWLVREAAVFGTR